MSRIGANDVPDIVALAAREARRARMSERPGYGNGVHVLGSQAVLSIPDMGLVYGDSVVDTARMFNKRMGADAGSQWQYR